MRTSRTNHQVQGALHPVTGVINPMVAPGRTRSSYPTKSSNHPDIVSVIVYFSRENKERYASLYVYADLFSWFLYTTHFQATGWSFHLLPAGQATLRHPQLRNFTHTVLTEWEPRHGISVSNLNHTWKTSTLGYLCAGCWHGSDCTSSWHFLKITSFITNTTAAIPHHLQLIK